MKTPQRSLAICAGMLLCNSVVICAAPTTPQQKQHQVKKQGNPVVPVFQKQLPNKEKLVVTLQHLPYVPDPAVEAIWQKWLKKQPPGTVIVPSNAVHLYSFLLVPEDIKKPRRVLWNQRYEDNEVNGVSSRGLTLLDATFDSGALLIFFKEATVTYANVIRPDPKHLGEFVQTFGNSLDTGLPTDENSTASATIEGSIKTDDVALKIINNRGQISRFLLKTEKGQDKWFKETPPAAPATAPEQAPAKAQDAPANGDNGF